MGIVMTAYILCGDAFKQGLCFCILMSPQDLCATVRVLPFPQGLLRYVLVAWRKMHLRSRPAIECCPAVPGCPTHDSIRRLFSGILYFLLFLVSGILLYYHKAKKYILNPQGLLTSLEKKAGRLDGRGASSLSKLLSGMFCFPSFWAPITLPLSPKSRYFLPRGYSTA